MYITHNLTEDKLLFAMKIGGLVMPSLAIINPDKKILNNFGEITFIGNENYFYPKSGKNSKTNTFNHDAYSPRMPEAYYVYQLESLKEKYYKVMDLIEKNSNKSMVFKHYGFHEVLSEENARRESDKIYVNNKRLFLLEAYFLSKNEKVDYVLSNLEEKLNKFKEGKEVYSVVEDFISKSKPQFSLEKMRMFLYINDKNIFKYDHTKLINELSKNFSNLSNDELYNLIEISTKLYYKKQGLVEVDYDIDKTIENLYKKANSIELYDFIKNINDSVNTPEVYSLKLLNGYTNNGTKKFIDYNIDNCLKKMNKLIRENGGDIRNNESQGNLDPRWVSFAELKSHRAFNKKLTGKKEIESEIANLKTPEEVKEFSEKAMKQLQEKIKEKLPNLLKDCTITTVEMMFISYVFDKFGEYPYEFKNGQEVPKYHMNLYYQSLNEEEKNILNQLLFDSYQYVKINQPSDYLEIKLKDKIPFDNDNLMTLERSCKGIIVPDNLKHLNEIKDFFEKRYVKVFVQKISNNENYDNLILNNMIKSISDFGDYKDNVITEIDNQIKEINEKHKNNFKL